MSSVGKIGTAGLVATVMVTAAWSAQAATFAATELSYDSALLSQFNLTNLGAFSATGTQSIAGRAVVGGNFTTTGTQTVCTTGTTCGNTTLGVTSSTSAGVVAVPANNASSSTSTAYGYGALTVFGNVTGAATVQTGGDLNIGGNVGGNTYTLNQKGGFNLGGTSQAATTVSGPTEVRTTSAATQGTVTNTPTGYTIQNTDTMAQVFAPFASATSVANNFTTPLKNLYSGLANLPGTPGVSAETLPAHQSGVFTSAVDYTSTVNGTTYKYGVVQTTLAALSAEGSAFTGITNGTGDSATFVIVSGTGANYALPTLTTADSKVIYDFVGASALSTGTGGFTGSILAPLATLSQGAGGTINGSVVVAAMNQTATLYNGNAFTGDLTGLTNFGYNSRVPEPASLGLMGAGVAALAAFRRRRTAAA